MSEIVQPEGDFQAFMRSGEYRRLAADIYTDLGLLAREVYVAHYSGMGPVCDWEMAAVVDERMIDMQRGRRATTSSERLAFRSEEKGTSVLASYTHGSLGTAPIENRPAIKGVLVSGFLLTRIGVICEGVGILGRDWYGHDWINSCEPIADEEGLNRVRATLSVITNPLPEL